MSDRNARRTLPTNSTRWREIRLVQLQREPLCRHCAEQGRIVPAEQVDHRNNDSGDNRPENLQSLCARCHSAKTWREQHGMEDKRVSVDGSPAHWQGG